MKQKSIFFSDENPSSSALAFQVACAFASEVANRLNVIVFLNEPKRNVRFDSKFQLVDLFQNEKLFDEFKLKNDEKSLILFDALPWLIIDKSESFLLRYLNELSSKKNPRCSFVFLDLIV